MIFSFVCYALYALLAFQAYGVVMAEGLKGDDLITAQKLVTMTSIGGLLFWA